MSEFSVHQALLDLSNTLNVVMRHLTAASGVNSGIKLLSGAGFNWANSTGDATQATDTGIVRIAATPLVLELELLQILRETWTAAVYKTNTNCAATGTAANPSVSLLLGGSGWIFFMCYYASTGTCVVNTNGSHSKQ